MVKPAEKLDWIPDNTTNITNPSGLKTAGFTSGQKVSANFNNYLFNRASQWIDWIDTTIIEADTTITVDSAAEYTAMAALLSSGVILLNNSTLTVNIDLTITPTTTLEINSISGGKLIFNSNPEFFYLNTSLHINNCSAEIEIRNIKNIKNLAAGESAVKVINCSKVWFKNCCITPTNALTEAESQTVLIDASNVLFDNVTGIAAPNSDYNYKIINNGHLHFTNSSRLDDAVATKPFYQIYCADSSSFSADCAVFTDTSLPVFCESGIYPKISTTISVGVTASNLSRVITFAANIRQIDADFDFVCDEAITLPIVFNNFISGSGSITFQGERYFEQIEFTKGSSIKIFVVTIIVYFKAANLAFLKLETPGTFGAPFALMSDSLFLENCNNVYLNGAVRDWVNSGIRCSNCKIRTKTFIPASSAPADQVLVIASDGSIVCASEALVSGNRVDITNGSLFIEEDGTVHGTSFTK